MLNYLSLTKCLWLWDQERSFWYQPQHIVFNSFVVVWFLHYVFSSCLHVFSSMNRMLWLAHCSEMQNLILKCCWWCIYSCPNIQEKNPIAKKIKSNSDNNHVIITDFLLMLWNVFFVNLVIFLCPMYLTDM